MTVAAYTRASFYTTVRRAACRKLTQGLVLAVATFVTLLVLWCTADSAHAAVYEEGPCVRRPMAQGIVGEQVTICELRRVPSTVRTTAPVAQRLAHAARRAGRTTVAHHGRRTVRVASLDSCDVSVWDEGTRLACTTVTHY